MLRRQRLGVVLAVAILLSIFWLPFGLAVAAGGLIGYLVSGDDKHDDM